MTVRAKPKERAQERAKGRSLRHEGTRGDFAAVPRTVLLVFSLIGLVGSLHVGVMIGVEVGRYSENTREISRLRGDVAAIDRELNSLRAVLEHAGDARYREQLARRQGFAYPGERRFFTVAPEEMGAGSSP